MSALMTVGLIFSVNPSIMLFRTLHKFFIITLGPTAQLFLNYEDLAIGHKPECIPGDFLITEKDPFICVSSRPDERWRNYSVLDLTFLKWHPIQMYRVLSDARLHPFDLQQSDYSINKQFSHGDSL